jgi:hypothetical protein
LEVDRTKAKEWPPETDDHIANQTNFHPSKSRWKSGKGSRHVKGIGPKFYGHTGNRQIGNSVTLSGVDALGKNAEVLVLRDSKVQSHKPKIKDIIVEAPTPESIDILARIESERGIVSSKDIENNINEFEPQKDKIQTWKDFNDIVQSLQTSFSHIQLNNYIRSYKKRMKKVPSLGLGIVTDKRAIVRVTPWVPDISPISQPLDEIPQRGYSPPSYNAKQILAVRVMRECWRLEVPELVEGIGEVEVQVEIKNLDFLISA